MRRDYDNHECRDSRDDHDRSYDEVHFTTMNIEMIDAIENMAVAT